MHFGLLLSLAIRNVFRNKRRSLLTIAAIAIGVLSANGISSLARGISNEAVQSAIMTFTGHLQIHHPSYLADPSIEYRMPEPSAELEQRLEQSDVLSWTTRLRLPAVIQSERDTAGVTLLGIDPERERAQTFLRDSVIHGSFLDSEAATGVVLGRALAKRLQTDIGKRVVIMSQHEDGTVADRGFRVIGLFDAELETTEKQFAFTGKMTLQTLVGVPAEVSELSLIAVDREKLSSITNSIRSLLPKLEVKDWKELEPFVVALLEVQSGFLYIWYLIVIVTIAFGLVNTLFMVLFERTREIGLLQALGMYPRQIVLQFLFESGVMLFVGAVFGNLLTVLLLWFFSNGIDVSQFAEGTELFGVGQRVFLHLRGSDQLIANLLIVILGLLASAYPAWKAGRLLPAVAFAKN